MFPTTQHGPASVLLHVGAHSGGRAPTKSQEIAKASDPLKGIEPLSNLLASLILHIYFRSSPSIPPHIANISKYILDLFKSRCWKTVEDSDPIRQFSSSPPASWYMAVTSRVCSSGSGHGIGPRLDTIGRGWFDNRRQGFTVHQIMHYQACDLCRSCVSCDTSLSWAAHLKIRHPLSAWGARIESSTWSISVIQSKGRRRKKWVKQFKNKRRELNCSKA